jgi:preprotein translocase subunit SecB
MTDDIQATDNPPVFAIEKIYVKDLSLEVPGAPQVFLVTERPQVGVQLRTEAGPINVEEGIFEVKLTITVRATLSEDRTFFLVEITQAGIFRIQNAPEEELELILGIGCPNIIFPYARETISDAVTRAGFQPVLLTPVNFEALFQQSRQHAGANQNPQVQ